MINVKEAWEIFKKRCEESMKIAEKSIREQVDFCEDEIDKLIRASAGACDDHCYYVFSLNIEEEVISTVVSELKSAGYTVDYIHLDDEEEYVEIAISWFWNLDKKPSIIAIS